MKYFLWTATSLWTHHRQVHPIWKFRELYDPSHCTTGILHNLCKTEKSVWLPQQMANRLFACFVRLFFGAVLFLFLGKHLFPNNIPTEILWIGGTVHSNPELAGCKTWHLLARLFGLL